MTRTSGIFGAILNYVDIVSTARDPFMGAKTIVRVILEDERFGQDCAGAISIGLLYLFLT